MAIMRVATSLLSVGDRLPKKWSKIKPTFKVENISAG